MNRRLTLVAILVLLVFVFMVASPMPVDEMGQSFDNQAGFGDDAPDVVKQFIDSAYAATVERATVDIDNGEITGDLTLSKSYTQSRTMVYLQVSGPCSFYSGKENQFNFYWKDADELTWNRAFGVATRDVDLTFWVVEFDTSASVTVTEYGDYDAPTTVTLPSEDVADRFIIVNGMVTGASSEWHPTSWAVVSVTSTTQATITNGGATDNWYDLYFQTVDCDDFYVQHGTLTRDADEIEDITISTVDIAQSTIFAQSYTSNAVHYHGWDHWGNVAYLTSATNLRLTCGNSYSGSFVKWQVVQWPDWANTQSVADTISGYEFYEDTTVSTYDIARSIVFLAGCAGPMQFQGMATTGAGAYMDDYILASELLTSTTTRSRRGDDPNLILTFRSAIIEFENINAPPVNDQAPVCTNLDTGDDELTDNLYARYKLYEFSVSTTDDDGYADISYVQLYSWDVGTTTLRWMVKFNQDTSTFSEVSGSDVIDLDISGSTYSESGINLDMTFKLYIEWVHLDATDDDLSQFVVDTASDSDMDSYDSNYDYETRLDLSPFSLSDGSGTADRGNYDTSNGVTASGTVIYFGSGDNYVPSDEADVWVSCAEVGGPWSDLVWTSGAFSMTVGSDDEVGLDTYTFKVVLEGTGSDGAEQLHATHSDTYVADYIVMRHQMSVEYYIDPNLEDSRTSMNTWMQYYIWLEYEYDDTIVSDGTVYLDWSVAWRDGNAAYTGASGKWKFDAAAFTENGVIMYSVDSIAVSGNIHGITVDTNHTQYEIIWDRVRVVSYTIVTPSGDNRNNIGTTYTIDIELHYDYDETDVADGTVTVNGDSMDSYQGLGKWRWTPTEAGVIGITYNNMQATGNTHGITAEDNTVTQLIIWDRVQVQSITAPVERCELDGNTFVDALLWYDYDNTAVTDGSATLEGTGMTHQSGGTWRLYTTEGTVQLVTYDTITASGNTHGITTVDMNGKSDTIIWDRIQVSGYSVSDERDNINDNVDIDVTLIYDYDDLELTDGTVTINGYSASHQGSGVWRITRTSASVTSVTYNTVAASGNTHDITVVDQNSQSQEVIWDEVDIFYGYADDNRANIGIYVGTYFKARLSYDGHLLAFGDSLSVNGTAATFYSGPDYWSPPSVMYDTVSSHVFLVSSVSEVTYGITALNSASAVTFSETIIWDRVQVQSYSASDARCNINDNINIDATLWYDYDDTLVTDGTVTINGYSASHQGSGVWRITRTSSTVTSVTYNNVQVSGNTYGITVEDQNEQSQQVIWDKIVVQTTVVDDNRVSVDANAEVRVTAWLDYDDSYLGSGDTIILDGTGMSWDAGNSWFDLARSKAAVGVWNYYVNSSSEATYGITALDVNGNSVDVIWDRIKILTTSATSSYIDKGTESTTVNVTAELEYDSHALGSADTLYLNDTLMTWDTDHFYIVFGPYDVFDSWLLFVNSTGANEVTYGITVINLNSQDATVATDRVIVISYSPSDARDNIGDWIWVIVTLQYESDSSQVTDGTVVINSYSYTHIGSGQWRHNRTESIVTGITFDTVVTASNVRSITLVNQNSQSQLIVWDQIVVQTTVADDSRVNINDDAEIRVTLWLDYDDEYLGSGDTVTLDDVSMSWDAGNSWFDLSRSQASVSIWKYFVNSSSEATYGITAFDVNSQDIDVIWDLVRVVSYTIVTPSGDNRNNIGTTYTIDVELHYDYDETDVVDGTVTVNGLSTTYQSLGKWRFSDSESTVMDTTYNNAQATGNTYGITVEDNTVTQQVIWDRIRVLSYTIVTPSGDNRNNIGTTYTIDVELHYDYDEVDLADGTVTVNGLTGTYQSLGKWRFTDVESTVMATTYNNVQASGNTHGITAEDNTVTQQVIWDRIYAVSLSYGGDTRINIATSVDFDYELHYDYDETDVADGTIVINSQSFTHQGSGVWRYTTDNGGSVGDITFDSIVASGNAHGITSTTTDGNDVTLIWDRVQVQSYSVSDARDDINDNVDIDATLWYDFDNTLVVDGTVTINSYSASHQGSGVWRITRTSSTVTSVTYNTVATSGNAHGITAVDQNSQDTSVIWDQVVFTLNVNMTWTVIDYYVNVSWTAIYDFDDVEYPGTCVVHNDDGVLTFSTVDNRTFYVTSIDDSGGYDLTAFTTNTVWCIWDDVVPSGAVAYSWLQYSATQVYLVWGIGSNWMWDYNDTLLNINVILHAYSNSSAPEASGSTYSDGAFGGLTIGPFTPDWHYVDLAINCEATISSIPYDWVIWSQILDVEILHTIQTNIWDLNREGDYYTLLMHTNYENASAMVWDDMTDGTGYGDATYYGNYEGMHEWLRDTTVGTHNCTILLNAGGDKGAVDRNYVENDLRLWYNFTYVISPAILAISDPVYTASEEQNFLSGETNVGCDWYAYNNDTEIDTGVLGVGSFAINWDKNTTAGYYVWGVKFDDGITTRWVNGTFEIDELVFVVTSSSYGVATSTAFQGGTVNKPCNYYIYEDDMWDSEGTLSIAQSFYLTWTRASDAEPGEVAVGIKFNTTDGETEWLNWTYSKSLTVAFKVEQWWMSLQLGIESYVEFYVLSSFENATVYVYDNETLMTTVTESEGGVYSYFWMSETQGLHVIVLNITHDSTVFTRTRTYYIPDWAATGLVMRWDLWTFQNNYTMITLESNWRNCTFYVYLNSSIVATAYVDPVTLNFTREINTGVYNLTLHADGGAQTYTIKNIRYIVTAEGVTYDYSSVTFSGGGTAYYTDYITYEAEEQLPPGAYISNETVLMVILGLVLFPVVVYVILDKMEIRMRIKNRRGS